QLHIQVKHANEGTSLVLDGQVSVSVQAGQRITIKSHTRKARFVANPSTAFWEILLEKMRWAAPPTYRDRGV
ncbi:MAG: hypothetical protein IIB99_04470, partial [Planctomycetes bacterium]|nr:hypothetical protein [Planctomycetota bacterium]